MLLRKYLNNLASEDKDNTNLPLIEAAIAAPLINRRFIVTKNSRYRLTPIATRSSDKI